MNTLSGAVDTFTISTKLLCNSTGLLTITLLDRVGNHINITFRVKLRISLILKRRPHIWGWFLRIQRFLIFDPRIFLRNWGILSFWGFFVRMFRVLRFLQSPISSRVSADIQPFPNSPTPNFCPGTFGCYGPQTFESTVIREYDFQTSNYSTSFPRLQLSY